LNFKDPAARLRAPRHEWPPRPSTASLCRRNLASGRRFRAASGGRNFTITSPLASGAPYRRRSLLPFIVFQIQGTESIHR
jgi:hypothetical protein